MPMLGLFHELLPPSGVEFAVFLKLRSTLILPNAEPCIVHLVVARDNFLRLYEIRRLQGSDEDKPARPSPHLFLVRQHLLHGTVTGLASVRTLSSDTDGCDRLLVSYQDAKLALLEWSDALYDITTVSIHSYERSPHVMNCDFGMSRARLRTDPAHRCAALCLPRDAIALLPWYQTQVELDMTETDQTTARDLPYSPSFVVEYATIDERIRNVVDQVFLPGFNTPTIAVLFQPEQTWTGRLKERKDNTCLFIISLDLVTKQYQVIVTVENLPYDALYLSPCPNAIGGVAVISANSVIHVDQASKVTALQMNGWAKRVTDLVLAGEEPASDIHLEGSHSTYLNDTKLLLVLVDGSMHEIDFEHEGRLVRRLVLRPALGVASPPSVVLAKDEIVFVGSTSYHSVLLENSSFVQNLNSGLKSSAANGMHMEFELYGEDANESGLVGAEKSGDSLALEATDSLEDPGLFTSACFCLTSRSDEPLLIAASGVGTVGGFTILNRKLATTLKKKIPAVAGRRGIWSMRIGQDTRPHGRPNIVEISTSDNYLFSTDATPSPGASRIATRSQARLDVNITSRLPMLTISIGTFFDGTHILQVTNNSIRLLSPDGVEKQVIKDTDGNMTRPKIRAASILDPFVLVLREDDTLGLFVGEPARGKIRRKDMSALGDKKSRYSAASFFFDRYNKMGVRVIHPHQSDNASTSISCDQWLVLCRPTGILEIWTLPKLSLAFVTEYALGPVVLQDNYSDATSSLLDDPAPATEILDQVLLTEVGESLAVPHIFFLFKSGLLLGYRGSESPGTILKGDQIRRPSTLTMQFVKVFVKKIESPAPEDGFLSASLIADRRSAPRTLIPFNTVYQKNRPLSGLFLTGDRPSWFIKLDKSDLLCLPCDYNVVYAMTPCSMWDSDANFLMNTEEGACLVAWDFNPSVHGQFTFETVRKGRTYSQVAFDPSTKLILAASNQNRPYVLFDDDGVSVWERDADNVAFPILSSSSLELIDPINWATVDGFEFGTNEIVNAVETVRLETLSTQSGNKDFLAVATSVYRGEDLAVRGCTYIFEVADVVQDIKSRGQRHHKLKLLCREEAKGPVTALCGMNGYLVSSMGQKVFVRAFDLDERLVGVAFLDAGVYITSLRCLKNLLVISDAAQSVWFVAFQEDPFKLIVLSKDARALSLLAAEFFFRGNDMELISLDSSGVLRLHAYDPTHLDAEEGSRLLCLVEFHTHAYLASILRVAKRQVTGDASPEASKLVLVYNSGSIATLDSVDAESFKRLYLLQSQLIRNTQHTSGLNPRSHRAVPGFSFGGASMKGVLDAQAFLHFQHIPFDKQQEITAPIGQARDAILHDCAYLEDQQWHL